MRGRSNALFTVRCAVCGVEVQSYARNRKLCDTHKRIHYKVALVETVPRGELQIVHDTHPLCLEGYSFTYKQIVSGIPKIFTDGTIFRQDRQEWVIKGGALVSMKVKGGLSHE